MILLAVCARVSAIVLIYASSSCSFLNHFDYFCTTTGLFFTARHLTPCFLFSGQHFTVSPSYVMPLWCHYFLSLELVLLTSFSIFSSFFTFAGFFFFDLKVLHLELKLCICRTRVCFPPLNAVCLGLAVTFGAKQAHQDLIKEVVLYVFKRTVEGFVCQWNILRLWSAAHFLD